MYTMYYIYYSNLTAIELNNFNILYRRIIHHTVTGNRVYSTNAKWQPYNISSLLDFNVTWNTRLILNIYIQCTSENMTQL